MLDRFLATLQFLTRIPLKPRSAGAAADLPAMAAFYPLVGLVLGLPAVLVGAGVYALVPSASILAGLLVVGLWAALTGGFHIDGLADTFDGLLSGKRGAEAGKVMKDSRVGTMGAVAVFLVLATKAVAIGLLLEQGLWGALIFAPMVGRFWGALAAFLGEPPEWAEKSIGSVLVGRVTASAVLAAGATTVVAGLILVWPVGWIGALLLGCGLGWFASWRARQCIGGITGDVLGAGIEVAESAALIGALMGSLL